MRLLLLLLWSVALPAQVSLVAVIPGARAAPAGAYAPSIELTVDMPSGLVVENCVLGPGYTEIHIFTQGSPTGPTVRRTLFAQDNLLTGPEDMGSFFVGPVIWQANQVGYVGEFIHVTAPLSSPSLILLSVPRVGVPLLIGFSETFPDSWGYDLRYLLALSTGIGTGLPAGYAPFAPFTIALDSLFFLTAEAASRNAWPWSVGSGLWAYQPNLVQAAYSILYIPPEPALAGLTLQLVGMTFGGFGLHPGGSAVWPFTIQP